MNIIEEINSEEFRKFLRENIIETKEVSGNIIVPNEFIIKIQSSDPYDWFDAFLAKESNPKELSEEEQQKKELALHLINIHIKRVILEEVAKINHDVTSELNSHFTVLESFGFKKIYEKEYLVKRDNSDYKEKEYMYYNNKTGMLATLDTYGGKINSSDLYFEGSIKNMENFYKLGVSRGYVNYSENIHSMNVDTRDMLSARLEALNSVIKFEPKWKSFDLQLYSYLSHKDKNGQIPREVWNNGKINKLKELPAEVLENLLGNNLYYYSREGYLEEFVKENNLNKKYFEVRDFLGTLSKEECKDLMVRHQLLDAKFSEKGVVYLFSQEIKDKAYNSNIDIDNLHKYGAIALEKAASILEKESYHAYKDTDRIKNQLSKMNNNEIEIVKKIANNNIIIKEEMNAIFNELGLNEVKVPTHKFKSTLQ